MSACEACFPAGNYLYGVPTAHVNTRGFHYYASVRSTRRAHVLEKQIQDGSAVPLVTRTGVEMKRIFLFDNVVVTVEELLFLFTIVNNRKWLDDIDLE